MPKPTAVFVIEYNSNGFPLPIRVEDSVPIRRFLVIDERQIEKVTRSEMPATAAVLIDAAAFQGHGTFTTRRCIQIIRGVHGMSPSILVLRNGKVSENIIEGDKEAGATDVLYHSALTETADASRMNHFLREGVLPPPPEKKKSAGNTAGIMTALREIKAIEDEPADPALDDETPVPEKGEAPPGITKTGIGDRPPSGKQWGSPTQFRARNKPPVKVNGAKRSIGNPSPPPAPATQPPNTSSGASLKPFWTLNPVSPAAQPKKGDDMPTTNQIPDIKALSDTITNALDQLTEAVKHHRAALETIESTAKSIHEESGTLLENIHQSSRMDLRDTSKGKAARKPRKASACGDGAQQESGDIILGGKSLSLPRETARVMRTVMSSPGKIFDANSVGKSNGSLIFHMMTIRQALEEKLGKKAAGIIETHRGQGYSFHPEALN
jgi:hypothetical protein